MYILLLQFRNIYKNIIVEIDPCMYIHICFAFF